MNDAQLQMILTALQSLGAESKTAFIWWLAMDKLVPVFGWLATFSGMLWIGVKVIGAITATSYMARLRDDLGIGNPGPLWVSEAKEVMAQVRKLRDQAKAKTP